MKATLVSRCRYFLNDTEDITVIGEKADIRHEKDNKSTRRATFMIKCEACDQDKALNVVAVDPVGVESNVLSTEQVRIKVDRDTLLRIYHRKFDETFLSARLDD